VKAAVYVRTGGPEVLRYEDVPDPVAGPGEVLVDVEAISIEGGDLGMRARGRAVDDPKSPFCVGYSAAGRIALLGEGVELEVGARVATFGQYGSHAQRRVVRAEHCWVLPDGVDALQAACVPVAFGTAYEALFEFGRLRAGETLFVQGAAGGVALAAVQLARRCGARVIGTVSNDAQMAAVTELGVDHAINRNEGSMPERVLSLTDGLGVHVALDPVGGRSLDDVLRVTRRGGRVALVGLSSRESTTMNAALLLLRSLTMHGFLLSEHFGEPRVHRYVDELLALVAAGELDVLVDRVFPLAQAADAHRYAEQHGRVGRVVMTT
jgi:NADPH:quinone reductase